LKKLLMRWGPAILVMAAIYILSAQPKSALPEFGAQDRLVKKLSHALGYAALAVSLLRGLEWDARHRRKYLYWSLVLAIVYAGTDEIHQIFSSGRGASLIDVAIDSLGAMAGLALQRYWLYQRRRRSLPVPSPTGFE
jgi:VanZ family protein